MQKKIRVALLFGGKSAEHEVSIQSARNIYRALDKTKYDVSLIGIDKKGAWLPFTLPKLLKNRGITAEEDSPNDLTQIFTKTIANREEGKPFDVVFPVLHGPYGEDGSVQGLCKLLGIACVGADVLGSAVGMDKDIMKRLLRDAGVPVAKFLIATKQNIPAFTKVKKTLGLPVFVKPANLGSSVGVSKVTNSEEFIKALKTAFSYDNKVLIEEGIVGREIECSVLGNDKPIASLPGEIILNAEFYDYKAKYIDENGAVLQIPADLPKSLVKKIQNLAIKTFTVLCLSGMARVDFFLDQNGGLLVNEVNTLPGFTNISMYPKLWEASNMPQSKLLDTLVSLALEKHASETKLHTTYS